LLDPITIKGFKSIASIEELKPINVVVGANGSGKSNFLGAFAFLQAISEERLQNYVTTAGGAEKVLHFGSKATKQIEPWLIFHQDERYKLTLSPTGDDGLFPSEETIYLGNKDRDPTVAVGLSARQQGRAAGISEPDVEYVSRYVRLWRLYHSE
jgi:predicted ATPase